MLNFTETGHSKRKMYRIKMAPFPFVKKSGDFRLRRNEMEPKISRISEFRVYLARCPNVPENSVPILRYIKDWLCLCLLLSYQKVRGWSIFHSNHVISMRLGHGLRLVEMVILTLKFPW